MPFGFSFGGSKQNQNGSFTGNDVFNQNTDFTQAPTNPGFSTDLVSGVAGAGQGFIGQDPTQYVAGANDTLKTANNNAINLSGTPWAYDGATDLTRGVAQSDTPDIASMIGQFTDPYTRQVVNATSADLDHSDNLARQGFDLQNAGAFGGSGLALAKGETEGALARNRATTLSGLRSQGYNTGLQGAEAQANLIQQQQGQRLAAAQGLDTIANDYGSTSRANIATQDQAGGVMQAIQQAFAQSPLAFQQFLTQMASGLPLQLFQGQTGTEAQSGNEVQSGTTQGSTTGSNGQFGFSLGK